MKNRRSRRLGKLLGLPVLAVCGFAIAATLASVGLADITTTDTSSTTNSTSTSTSTTTTTTPKAGRAARPGSGRTTPIRRGPASGLTPTTRTDLVSSVFSAAPAGIGSKTLLAGLQQGGGQLDALTRHAIAAVLSAAHPDIDYPLTVDEIVDMVNDAYLGLTDVEDLKNDLDTFNNLGCDISQNA